MQNAKRQTAAMSAMETLHSQLAEALTKGVQYETKIVPAELNDEGEEIKPERTVEIAPLPAVLAVAAKFLKDNSVFASPEQSTAVGDLQTRLEQRKINRKPSAQDERDALAQLGASLLQ